MAELRDQLRAYGRQIEEEIADRPAAAEGSAPGPSEARPATWYRRSSWFLVAATTVAVALTASVLVPLTRPEGDDMNKGTGAALGLCLFAAACTSTPEGTNAPTDPPAAETASSSASATVPSLFAEGPTFIEPGTYVVDVLGTDMTITVPEGWRRFETFGVEGPKFSYLGFLDVTEVPTDACQWEGSSEPIGPTVDDLVTAIRGQEHTVSTEPEPRDIDGRRGVYLEVHQPADINQLECDQGTLVGFQDSEGGQAAVVRPHGRQGLWVVDLDGKRGVITWASFAPLEPQTEAEIMSMLESLHIQSTG